MSDEEKWIVVWWDDRDNLYTLTEEDSDEIVARPFNEIVDMIDEPLSDPDKHAAKRRYALPVSLARNTFGWDV